MLSKQKFSCLTKSLCCAGVSAYPTAEENKLTAGGSCVRMFVPVICNGETLPLIKLGEHKQKPCHAASFVERSNYVIARPDVFAAGGAGKRSTRYTKE